jgi:hypothetical protein
VSAASTRAHCATTVVRPMKLVGKPDAGNRHVRFDERGQETECCHTAQATACALLYTHHARASTTTAFNPPNANEFDMAIRSCAWRATLGTKSRSHAGSGSSKFAVGGMICV